MIQVLSCKYGPDCTNIVKIVLVEGCSVSNKGQKGLDIKTGYTASAEKCAHDCRLNAACKGSTHDPQNLCWLHSAVDKNRFYYKNGYTLFTKECQRSEFLLWSALVVLALFLLIISLSVIRPFNFSAVW